MRLVVTACVLATYAVSARAQAPRLSPELAGVAFLVGNWGSGKGVVAETGGTSAGSSRIEAVANGGALLRRDETRLFDKAGKPSGEFDQIMLIYPEDGTLHADYSDGRHLIHYTSATVVAGKSVIFTTAPRGGMPAFRLSYSLTSPDTLAVAFAMAAPGAASLHPLATGTLVRQK